MFKAAWEKSKSCAAAVAVPVAHKTTAITKGIHYKANALSLKMDMANGGWLKHGGFHRLYGGHDISNTVYWKHYGVQYGKELGKDFITPNGLPYPKLELAVKKGYIKASLAQKWGTWNVGKAASASVGFLDTAFAVKKFAKKRDQFSEHWKSKTLKGGVKLSVGLSSGNIPLAVAGAVDLSMIAYAKLEKQVAFDFDAEDQDLILGGVCFA